MYFTKIRSDVPEAMFIVVYNSYSTASLTTGQALMHDYATDADGISVTKPAASISAGVGHFGNAFAGIANETIAAGAYGPAQVWGYRSDVRVRTNTGGKPAIAAGVALTLQNAVFCLESFLGCVPATSTLTQHVFHPAGFALAAQASWTTKAVAAFIKAL